LSFKDPAQWFKDILQSIERISSHVADMSFDSFREDIKTIDAVERNLQKISEAAIRLGPQADMLCPGPPWAEIRGLGNWLRHQYDRVDLETVWHTVAEDLPPLKAAVIMVLHRLENHPEPPPA
jgi:uncharacterized protein with HEPN domain